MLSPQRRPLHPEPDHRHAALHRAVAHPEGGDGRRGGASWEANAMEGDPGAGDDEDAARARFEGNVIVQLIVNKFFQVGVQAFLPYPSPATERNMGEYGKGMWTFMLQRQGLKNAGRIPAAIVLTAGIAAGAAGSGSGGAGDGDGDGSERQETRRPCGSCRRACGCT